MPERRPDESTLRSATASDADGLWSLFSRLERAPPFLPWMPGDSQPSPGGAPLEH